MTFDFTIKTKQDLVDAVDRCGFVPLFANSVPGFSIEEHVDEAVWFNGTGDGVWEWKGPVIRETGCAYGKFLEKKAVFVSREWFPDFANYRRDGYGFDARYDDGLAPFRDKEFYDLLDETAPIMTGDLRDKGQYRKGGKKGFEGIITRLQTQCYVVISDFKYKKDKHGKQYGWGVAEYSTPEKLMSGEFTEKVYACSPEESHDRVLGHLRELLTWADEAAIRKMLK